MADGRWRGVTRVLPWIVIDSFLWAFFFLLQVIRVGEELVRRLKRSRHRLACIQSVLSFSSKCPVCRGRGGGAHCQAVSVFIPFHVGLLSLSNELFKIQVACSEVESVNSSIQLSPRNLRSESGSKRETIKHLQPFALFMQPHHHTSDNIAANAAPSSVRFHSYAFANPHLFPIWTSGAQWTRGEQQPWKGHQAITGHTPLTWILIPVGDMGSIWCVSLDCGRKPAEREINRLN